MDVGGRLLASLLAKGSIVAYKNLRLNQDYFIEQEQALFNYVETFVGKYNKLPTLDTAKEKFKDIPKPVEPPEFYYDQIEQRFSQRALNRALLDCNELMKMQDIGGVRMKLAEVQARLDQFGVRRAITDFRTDSWDMVRANYFATVYKQQQQELFFGWPRFDKQCEGMGGGHLISMVGRPGMGKTYLTLKAPLFTWQFCQGVPLFISMEMPVLDISQRLVAMYAPWGMTAVQSSNITQMGIKALNKKMATAAEFINPFYIVDGRHVKTAEDVRTLVAMLKPTCVATDAAYRMQPPKGMRMNMKDRIDYNIEWLADNVYSFYGIPGYHSYQLSREAAKKMKKGKGETVDLEDIYYSDAIGQLSSVVLGLFQNESVETILEREVTVMKGRRGETGAFKIFWDFVTMNFGEVDPDADKAVHQMQFVE